MRRYALLIAAAVAGLAVGLVSLTPLLAGQWANLIVWAVVGLVLGWFARDRRAILGAGILAGWSLFSSVRGCGGLSASG